MFLLAEKAAEGMAFGEFCFVPVCVGIILFVVWLSSKKPPETPKPPSNKYTV